MLPSIQHVFTGPCNKFAVSSMYALHNNNQLKQAKNSADKSH
jgi:hypothetical protein